MDGTYTETAKGKKGDFEVTVVIEDGTIADVSIGDNQETPDKGGDSIVYRSWRIDIYLALS